MVLSLILDSPKYDVHQRNLYNHFMGICQQCGALDYFITFKGNPKWKEIVSNLASGVKVEDRHDLVACPV